MRLEVDAILTEKTGEWLELRKNLNGELSLTTSSSELAILRRTAHWTGHLLDDYEGVMAQYEPLKPETPWYYRPMPGYKRF